MVGDGVEVGVGQLLGDDVHLRALAPALAIEEQLVHDEQLGLSADVGNVGVFGLAVLAMAGGALGDLVLQRLRGRRQLEPQATGAARSERRRAASAQ